MRRALLLIMMLSTPCPVRAQGLPAEAAVPCEAALAAAARIERALSDAKAHGVIGEGFADGDARIAAGALVGHGQAEAARVQAICKGTARSADVAEALRLEHTMSVSVSFLSSNEVCAPPISESRVCPVLAPELASAVAPDAAMLVSRLHEVLEAIATPNDSYGLAASPFDALERVAALFEHAVLFTTPADLLSDDIPRTAPSTPEEESFRRSLHVLLIRSQYRRLTYFDTEIRALRAQLAKLDQISQANRSVIDIWLAFQEGWEAHRRAFSRC